MTRETYPPNESCHKHIGKQNEKMEETATTEKLKNHARGRAQIDLIEIQLEQSHESKRFFVYEDLLSKFIVLQAVNEGTIQEIALKLLDLFAIIGIPTILQSNNGRKFAEQIVHELRYLWKELDILHGDIAVCDKTKRDIKSILESWILENPTKTWFEGLKSIQIHQNSLDHWQDGRNPSEILLGSNFFDEYIKRDITDDIWSEEEWSGCLPIANGNGNFTPDSDLSEQSLKEYESNTELGEGSGTASDMVFRKPSHENDSKPNENIDDSQAIKNGRQNVAEETEETEKEPKNGNEARSHDSSQSLKCNYCPKKYMKIGNLRNHMKNHRKGRIRECLQCDKTFRSLNSYEMHLRDFHKDQEEEEKDEERSNKCKREGNRDLKKTVFEGGASMRNGRLCESTNESNGDSSTVDTGPTEDVRVSKKTCRNVGKKDTWPAKVNGELECAYCGQKFNFPSVLKRHMRSHTNERPYVCEICKKSFKQLGHLSQHSLTHRDYRSFRCMACGVKFESLDALKIHSQSHKDDKDASRSKDIYRLFECDNCKKVFTTKSVLERHIFTHTHERQFACKICGKRFKQAGHVKSHMLIHTGERKYECTVCSKRFSLSNSLKKHMYVHNGERPYQCDMCGARFLERRNLNGHIMTHTNERPFCCKICGKRYTLADTLRRHVSAAHEDGRTYQCEICAKMFKQLAHLSVHKKVHNDERPFQCHLCDKNFKHKNVLKSHLAIHANVRPFECDICKATFVRKTNLQTHIASAHMNERPYSCTICDKRFKQISHLNGHVVVHSNSMPYQCDFCDRRCNRLDNLKKHMRLHTKDKE